MTGLFRRTSGNGVPGGSARTLARLLLLAALTAGASAQAQSVPAPAPTPAAADDYPPPEEAQAAPDVAPIAVTTLATGTALSLDWVGQPVTVLTRDDMARIGGADFTRVLAAIPGATWERNGAAGAYTGLHLRGAGSDDTLVMIDGVRMPDVGSVGGGFDFGTLTGVGIDRIDVLRGAGSLVWGSGAIGGVIALTTPETKGLAASVEVGSRDTLAGNLAYGIVRDRYALSLNAGYTATDDIPARREDGPGGFHQWRFGGRARANLTPTLSINASARYADDKATGNAFPLPPELAGATAQALDTEQFSGRAWAHFDSGTVTLDSGYSLAATRRVYAARGTAGLVSANWLGKSERIDLTGSVKLPARLVANFGADAEWTAISGGGDARHSAAITSGHVLLGWYGPVAAVTAGLRIDDHSQFGSHDSYAINASIKLAEHLRLRGSYATGFKAPTLYQLYSSYGRATLRPETARSYDGGLEYSARDGQVRLAATVYRRDSRDLIGLAGCLATNELACSSLLGGTFANIGAARADGVELEAVLAPSAKWHLSGAYSFVHATDQTPFSVNQGSDLARRPRHAFTAAADWTSPFKGVVLGVDLHMQSASWDDADHTVRLPAGAITTLRASLPFGSFVEFYGRVENLFNNHLPTIDGYGATGRGVFVGVRARI
ncbi:TonB-dependent receptor [Novosphingobium sp.]|uniref:TonB-dependent receptor plug domain-containing protein n=1 Tax=Novosphingobium sp. TaxID=1874826 RepID=UPI0033404D95